MSKRIRLSRLQMQSFLDFFFPPGRPIRKDWSEHYKTMRRKYRQIGDSELAKTYRIFRNHIVRVNSNYRLTVP